MAIHQPTPPTAPVAPVVPGARESDTGSTAQTSSTENSSGIHISINAPQPNANTTNANNSASAVNQSNGDGNSNTDGADTSKDNQAAAQAQPEEGQQSAQAYLNDSSNGNENSESVQQPIEPYHGSVFDSISVTSLFIVFLAAFAFFMWRSLRKKKSSNVFNSRKQTQIKKTMSSAKNEESGSFDRKLNSMADSDKDDKNKGRNFEIRV